MKIAPKATQSPSKQAPKLVPLYLINDRKGVLVTATFDEALAARLEKSANNKLIETQAKSRDLRGMYAKLFGLSGVAKKGGLASVKNLSDKERSARMRKAANARWGK